MFIHSSPTIQPASLSIRHSPRTIPRSRARAPVSPYRSNRSPHKAHPPTTRRLLYASFSCPPPRLLPPACFTRPARSSKTGTKGTSGRCRAASGYPLTAASPSSYSRWVGMCTPPSAPPLSASARVVCGRGSSGASPQAFGGEQTQGKTR